MAVALSKLADMGIALPKLAKNEAL